jgi:hypothetical protein
MANRLIPDDEDFWALLERGKEPLLLQLALAEDGERDSDQPYRLPVPITDRVALAAYHRVQDALAQQRRQASLAARVAWLIQDGPSAQQ